MKNSTIWLMTLISNSTVDLLKHIIENIAYAFILIQIKGIVFLLEVAWDSRMTREGYDQCLGISHNLSPILP